MKRRRSCCFLLAVMVCLGGAGEAANLEIIPLRNWAAPATWSASVPAAGKGLSLRTTMAVPPPVPFIPTTPCRIADTRDGSYPATFGPPQLVGGGAARTFSIPTGPCAGIPATAVAYSLNFTVVAPGGTPAGGYLTVFPTGGTQPVVSTLNFGSNSILANAAIVPAGTSGGINVFVNFSTDLIIDINGFYANVMPSSQTFSIETTGIYGIFGVSSTGVGVVGSGPIIGVGGANTGGASGIGVKGIGGAGIGVQGTSDSLNGVWAQSTNQDGLFASGGRDGAYVTGGRHGLLADSTAASGVVYGIQGAIGVGAGSSSAGVHGVGATTSGKSYGVLGDSFSNFTDSAGVRGVDRAPANLGTTSYIPSGVRGESSIDAGVVGLSNYVAILGARHDGTGVSTARGYIGYSTYAFYGEVGDYGGVGAKYFVEPYPLDASKVIRYISLEGPESGTYFRGKSETDGGRAVIPVPEHFRMVSDTEGITVHLTPVGHFAQIWVESSDLSEIIVRSSRDVTFNYIVHGVRRAFKDFNPISQGEEFMPQTPRDTLSPGLPAEIRERLIATGIYNRDGTVNMRTAERLGWDKVWTARGFDQK